jgi:DNA-binding transcriptional ArsR family regulator
MVTDQRIFHAIADPTRRRILAGLREGAIGTGRLASMFPVSRPAVSKHLRVLVDAGLVRRRRVGRRCLYTLHAPPLRAVREWILLFGRSKGRRSGSSAR